MKIYAETERLILREVLPIDVDGMFELDSDPLVHLYLGNKPITTKDQAMEAIEFIRRQYDERGIGRWTAIEKSSGDFIGWSGLKLNMGIKEELDGQQNFYDVGYRFIPRYWRKGYATESALAAMEYGFNIMRLETIDGIALIDNIGSNKVLQRIGLKHTHNFIYEDTQASWYQLKLKEYEQEMS